jgi:hypothetical protein
VAEHDLPARVVFGKIDEPEPGDAG